MIRCSAVNIGRFSTRSKSSLEDPDETLKAGIKHRSKAYKARSAKSDAAPISIRVIFSLQALCCPTKRGAYQIGAYIPRSSEATYQRARGRLVTMPSTR